MDKIEETTKQLAKNFVRAAEAAGIPYHRQRDIWVGALMDARSAYGKEKEEHDLRR